VCELSGKTIPRRRLDAIPWARYTAPVQAQLEEQGVLPHAHLNGAAFVPRESNGS
jgi:RNA polymerase-binding transcription factor DksA